MLLAPAGTPRSILNQINKEVTRVVNFPEIKQQMLTQGLVPATTAPGEYDKLLHAQIKSPAKFVTVAGIKAE